MALLGAARYAFAEATWTQILPDWIGSQWLAVNQFTVVEKKHERRPDSMLLVTGLPLGVIELKNPADEHATDRSAFQQLQTYKADIFFFAFNAALVVSDGTEARIGTPTAQWCAPRRGLALVRDCIVFKDDGSRALAGKMAGYHQFHAVETAVFGVNYFCR
ncbi:MAG: type I restriction endonuclease subunit R [Acidobacteria bacterium]|nr:type I restriction endonuclease subunit R [Acidobacteriota bacterium]